ncbi:AAA family ATPase [Rhizobium rhizogenes]|uniref:AAA family ATPase n=1 Tax=Rhizobium rhizogenes TaxID=359 RepID=A0AA92C5D0_RHIRH|nr:AAA family ATPase [Rhizobium rhizogenes]PVE56382.1 AAA family ATPase [Rhizobium rhizogenes]PVE64877.1 AAA family ATPase [Agrobacterium tumefaciens]PVE74015.1 AAA family ATPase [Sphingomonas sp. TPD3009]
MPNYISDIAEAARLLGHASRVLVVGSSGGGKTTLSRQVAHHLQAEYFSIDRDVRWLPNWTQREQGEQHRIIRDIVVHDRWVLDGSNPSTFDIRLPRTDVVIWMRLSRLTCLAGIGRRVMRNYGRVRPDMADGCAEPLPNLEFLTYIWTFEQRHAPLFVRNFDLYGPEVPIFQVKSRREADRLLDLMRSAP